MGAKLWYITGYIGFSNCDGPEDYNLAEYMWFDNYFEKETVEDLLCYYFSRKYRYVEIVVKEAGIRL